MTTTEELLRALKDARNEEDLYKAKSMQDGYDEHVRFSEMCR